MPIYLRPDTARCRRDIPYRAEELKATDDRNARSARSVRVKRQEDATDARYRKGGRRVG